MSDGSETADDQDSDIPSITDSPSPSASIPSEQLAVETRHLSVHRRQHGSLSTNLSDQECLEWQVDVNDSRWINMKNRMNLPYEIRRVQALVLHLLHSGESVLLLARTGWGKSLIFRGLYWVARDGDTENPTEKYITVVFVPLSGIGQEQVDEINAFCKRADAIFYDKTKVGGTYMDDIRVGKYKWLFISPEKALEPEFLKKVWKNREFKSKLLLIAVDEGHLVSEWGAPPGAGDKAFRESFYQLGTIRGILGDRVPWFVTSATMPQSMQKEVMSNIGIGYYRCITTALDRPNLYYNLLISDYPELYTGKGPCCIDFTLDSVCIPSAPLPSQETGSTATTNTSTSSPNTPVASSNTKAQKIPKTIIYVDNKQQLKRYIRRLRALLSDGLKHLGSTIIQGYYRERSDGDKARIREAFRKGECRIMIATEAFGLGLDIPDIERVYQVSLTKIGSPAHLQQRFGRAGRSPTMKAICTLILPNTWKKLGKTNPSDFRPTNGVQRRLRDNKPAIWNWVTAPCFRAANLDYLNASGQYNPAEFSIGTCCSRCTTQAIDQNTIPPNIKVIKGLDGLCDPAVQEQRRTHAAEQKAKRKENKTHPIFTMRAKESLLNWRKRVFTEVRKTSFVSLLEVVCPNKVVNEISDNFIMYYNGSLEPAWSTKLQYQNICNNDDTIENVIKTVFDEYADEVHEAEKQEKEAKTEARRTQAQASRLAKKAILGKTQNKSQGNSLSSGEESMSPSSDTSDAESGMSESNIDSEPELNRGCIGDIDLIPKKKRGRPTGSKDTKQRKTRSDKGTPSPRRRGRTPNSPIGSQIPSSPLREVSSQDSAYGINSQQDSDYSDYDASPGLSGAIQPPEDTVTKRKRGRPRGSTTKAKAQKINQRLNIESESPDSSEEFEPNSSQEAEIFGKPSQKKQRSSQRFKGPSQLSNQWTNEDLSEPNDFSQQSNETFSQEPHGTMSPVGDYLLMHDNNEGLSQMSTPDSIGQRYSPNINYNFSQNSDYDYSQRPITADTSIGDHLQHSTFNEGLSQVSNQYPTSERLNPKSNSDVSQNFEENID